MNPGPRRQDGMGRIRFLGTTVCLLLLLSAARAFQLQVLHREDLRERAFRQSRALVPVHPRRGPILDCTGQPLAVTVPVPSVYAIRDDVTDRLGTAQVLAGVLGEDRETLRGRLEGNGFVWLKRRVPPGLAEQVARLALPGIGLQEEARRYYPSSDLAAAVLGFVGTDRGLEGLECALEEQLRGQRQDRLLEKDALGKTISGDAPPDPAPSVGSTVTLTLDRTIQFFAEEALGRGCRDTGGKSGAAVVLESRTGRILAMASYPSFDPNEFARYGQEEFRNRAVGFVYEPGSTFKVVTLAAAIEEGIYDEDDVFFCNNGRFHVADRVIRDHLPQGYLTLTGIMKKSSNIGACKVGMELGRERLYRYARSFGLGERTDVLLPGEGKGILREPSDWTVVDTANISFGQGLSTTPLQVAAAINVVAAGGQYMEPFLVERIVGAGGEVVMSQRPEASRRVISERTADRIRAMMETVVTADGSGNRAAIPGYRVAGKTGTAQKFVPEEGGYSTDRYVASFAGFAPSREPAVTAIVVIDEPEDDSFGGVVAAPVWADIVGRTLEYLNVEPDRDVAPEDRRKKAPERKIARAEKVTVEPAEGSVPDLRGLTLREALEKLAPMGVKVLSAGSGVVVSQVPDPGTEAQGPVRLTLEPRFGT